MIWIYYIDAWIILVHVAVVRIMINFAVVDGRIILCTVVGVVVVDYGDGVGVNLILAIIVIGINYAAVDGRI